MGNSASLVITNKTKYRLDITATFVRKSQIYDFFGGKSESVKPTQWYCKPNDVSKVESEFVAYPLVEIKCLNEKDEVVKTAKFFSWSKYSWIVTDDYIHRGTGESPDTEDPQSESRKPPFKEEDFWENCDKIYRYYW